MSECYVIERFVGTVAQPSVCVWGRLYMRKEQVRAVMMINQGQRRSSNLGFRTLHAEQQRNTFMGKYCRYISAEFCRYYTSATSSYRPIYIGVPIHRSSSIYYFAWQTDFFLLPLQLLIFSRGGARHFHLGGPLEGPVLQQGELPMVCVGLSERDLKNFGGATGGARQNFGWAAAPPGTPLAPPLTIVTSNFHESYSTFYLFRPFCNFQFAYLRNYGYISVLHISEIAYLTICISQKLRLYLRNYDANLWDLFHNPCFGRTSWSIFTTAPSWGLLHLNQIVTLTVSNSLLLFKEPLFFAHLK